MVFCQGEVCRPSRDSKSAESHELRPSKAQTNELVGHLNQTYKKVFEL